MPLDEIRPIQHQRIIDLVHEAGVNTSEWSEGNLGEAGASTNPKFVFEWSFVEPQKTVVLCLWHEIMAENNGKIIYNLNLRTHAENLHFTTKQRALRMDKAIQRAIEEKLPIQVVVCSGRREDGTTSRAKKRLLDKKLWSVQSYDDDSGECTLCRGTSDTFIDQFSHTDIGDDLVEKRDVNGQVFVRKAEVRSQVLRRAKGNCECCGQSGFVSFNGSIYLETHHIVPLSENGSDETSNVIALCPNHHKEAHFGINKVELRESFIEIVANTGNAAI